MAIGPMSSPNGKPQSGDAGGLHAGFRVLPGCRLATMEFRTVLDFLCASPDHAQQMAAVIRTRITGAFGKLSYNVATLPFTVVANHNKGMVEVYLPQGVSDIIAHPELWLALAQRMDEEARKLTQ